MLLLRKRIRRTSCILLLAAIGYIFLKIQFELVTTFNKIFPQSTFRSYNISSMHHPRNADPYFQHVTEIGDYAYVLSAFFNEKS